VADAKGTYEIKIEYGTMVAGTFTLLPAVAGNGLPARPADVTLPFGGGGAGAGPVVAGANAWNSPIVNLVGWPANPAPGQFVVRATLWTWISQMTLVFWHGECAGTL